MAAGLGKACLECTPTAGRRASVNSRPLPCRPPPIEDELLSSWITRLAQANHCSVQEFCGYLDFEQGRVPETVSELVNGNLDHLSFLVQLPTSEVTAMTLPDGIRFEVQYVSQHDFQKCAVCTLQTPGLVLRHWRFVWATACQRCGQALVALCPADDEIVPEKLICRANRGAEILRSAFCDGDLRLCRRLGRVFYMLRSRDLAQSTSLTSGE
ncbi:TniQ family protein [Shimia thalassica]|uniref:TniQ family protein n=1 Tax=Shimia thalassica TaxID=1715693 RepID=UPI003D6638AA